MYQTVLEHCKQHQATLVAVSKTKPAQDIKALYIKGQKHFGENKVQELMDKYEELPKDIHWHLIGHLQTNKVKYIVPFVHMIHSVDSIKLLDEIQKEAAKIFRTVNVLLQIDIAQEDTKYGLNLQEAQELLEIYTAQKNNYNYINICGVMGMATFTDNQAQLATEFSTLKNNFQFLKDTYFPFTASFAEISMGMSGDYQLALAHGSTMVRVGSLIFGAR
jgi:PLP dependent protein